MHPYPIRELATWWNNLDLGAPPTECHVFEIDRFGLDPLESDELKPAFDEPTGDSEDDSLEHALALITASRIRDLELEPMSTALVSVSLGRGFMELTSPRFHLDGTIDYDNWIESLAAVRDKIHELASSDTADREPLPTGEQQAPALPEPFNRIERLIIERSQAGLATLINGPTAAAAFLTAYNREPQVIDHVRFLSYSPSALAMQVTEYLRVPAVVPIVISYIDDTIQQLALDTISAAVNNAENSRLALLADLNPQTEE